MSTMGSPSVPGADGEPLFSGSVPRLYDELLVPMIFVPYARDLARRAGGRQPGELLELAAGTGVVTRELTDRLPLSTSIVATDLSQPMLDQAARTGARQPVTWQQVDAMQLPFAARTFDLVVCQFGVMFFPDRAHAFAEARRVLRPGGAFLFNTWEAIEANEFAHTVQGALTALYPTDPPLFMARTPHGYCDPDVIRADLARGGFRAPAEVTPLPARSRSDSARNVARAYCQGTPLRAQLEARGPDEVARATDAAEAAVARRFGDGPIEGTLSALVVEIVA